MGDARKICAAAASVLICPVCGSGMGAHGGGGTLACEAGHSFDVAKEGYVNLSRHGAGGKYEAALFQSRRRLAKTGLWDPLLDVLAEYVDGGEGNDGERASLLDAGCGEGSHLKGLLQRLARKGIIVQGYGMDLAKEGVRMAAKYNPGAIWCVGDLAAAPFKSGSFDAIVNILSPSNYKEFRRMLKRNGLLAKVIPNPDHLIELRNAMQMGKERNCALRGRTSAAGGTGRNGSPGRLAGVPETAGLFAERMRDAVARRIRYRRPVDRELAGDLLRMTPLAWGADMPLDDAAARIGETVTIDVTLLIGRN